MVVSIAEGGTTARAVIDPGRALYVFGEGLRTVRKILKKLSFDNAFEHAVARRAFAIGSSLSFESMKVSAKRSTEISRRA